MIIEKLEIACRCIVCGSINVNNRDYAKPDSEAYESLMTQIRVFEEKNGGKIPTAESTCHECRRREKK